MKRPLGNIVLAAIGLSFAYFIVSFSLRLAGIRIYQVDECQNVFVAALVASGQAHNYFASVTLFVVPLAWLIRGAAHSIDMFTSARLVSLLIFWLNLLFIATATGSRLLSRRWLIALMGAATLAPLWDYGFEIRHDNLLLTGLLLSWCLVRFPPVGILSYTVVGALATAMQFTAFKAFVYTLPLTLVVLALPPIGSRIARWKLASAWTAGAVAMFLVIRLAYGAAGIWDVYLAGVKWASTISTGGTRFGPWGTLSRLLTQTPLLLALLPAAAITLGMELYHQGKSALTWEGNLPEALLFLLALGVLIINPAPHPYNLLNLVPFAYLFTFRYASTIVPAIWDSLAMRPLVLGVLLFAHVVPFWIATRRHLNWPNYNQEAIMRLAEDLTDPARDQVYDGIGMVPTRRSSGYSWFLHSLNLQYFIDGSRSRVREMLAEKPASVFIPSYRTDWLPKEDHDFISERYVPMADDFWVLGKVLPAGGGDFEIVHAGRYRISSLDGSDIMGTFNPEMPESDAPEKTGSLTGTVDGKPLVAGVMELTAGQHRIQTSPDCRPAVVWVGPKFDRIHPLRSGDHRMLFVNWY